MSAGLIFQLGWIFLKPYHFVYTFHLVIPILVSYGFIQLYDKLGEGRKGIQSLFCVAILLSLPLHWMALQDPRRVDFEIDRVHANSHSTHDF